MKYMTSECEVVTARTRSSSGSHTVSGGTLDGADHVGDRAGMIKIEEQTVWCIAAILYRAITCGETLVGTTRIKGREPGMGR